MGSQALDAAARAHGFRDFATFQAYQRHQEMMRQGPNVIGDGNTAPAPAAPQQPAANAPPQNWLQRLMWGLSGGK